MKKKLFYIPLVIAIGGITLFSGWQNAEAAYYINITSPAGGEQWQVETTHNITWEVSSGITFIQIDLLKNGTRNISIERVKAADKSYTWTVPSDLKTGNDYQIQLYNPGNPTVPPPAISSYFSIIEAPVPPPPTQVCPYECCLSEPGYIDKSCPSGQICINRQCQEPPSTAFVRIISPNGGEEWTLGTKHNVTWAASSEIKRVEILLYKGGSSVLVVSQNIDAKIGSCQWLIPSDIELGNNYRARIFNTANPVAQSDFSDAYFSIVEKAPDCPSGQKRPHKEYIDGVCQLIDSCGVDKCELEASPPGGGTIKIAKGKLELAWPNSPMGTSLTDNSKLVDFVKYLYEWGIALGGLAAFIALVIAGFQYLTSAGNAMKMSNAMKRIQSAVLGLLLLLSSVLILNTINPQLTTLKMPSGLSETKLNPVEIQEKKGPSVECQKVEIYSTAGGSLPIYPDTDCKSLGASISSIIIHGSCEVELYSQIRNCDNQFLVGAVRYVAEENMPESREFTNIKDLIKYSDEEAYSVKVKPITYDIKY